MHGQSLKLDTKCGDGVSAAFLAHLQARSLQKKRVKGGHSEWDGPRGSGLLCGPAHGSTVSGQSTTSFLPETAGVGAAQERSPSGDAGAETRNATRRG